MTPVQEIIKLREKVIYLQKALADRDRHIETLRDKVREMLVDIKK